MNVVYVIFYGVFSDVFEVVLCMEVDVFVLCYYFFYNVLWVKLDLFKDLSIRIEYLLNVYFNISIYVREGNRVFFLVFKISMVVEFFVVLLYLNILVFVVDFCWLFFIKVCFVLEVLVKIVKLILIWCVVVVWGVIVCGGWCDLVVWDFVGVGY